MPVRECATCGTSVAADARFCPECGRSLAAEVGALDAPILGRGPSLRRVSEPILVVAAAAVLAAAVLAVRGEWAWAVVAILAAAVAALSLDRLSVGSSPRAVAALRARAAATREAMAARSREQVELFRARRELTALEAERERLLVDLGRAAYEGDEPGIRAGRSALDDVAARIDAKEAEIEALKAETSERVDAAHASARPTERVDTPADPAPDEPGNVAGEAASPGEERSPA